MINEMMMRGKSPLFDCSSNKSGCRDTVNHKVFGKGTILEYLPSKESFKIDFNGSVRFIRADFFNR